MKRPALGPRGRAFWNHCTATYSLSEAEVQLVAEACRTMDTLELLAATVIEVGASTVGSQGQEKTNPAIAEARQQRLTLARLISQLRLPDADGAAIPTGTTLSAIDAGHARHRPIRVAKAG